ncbi:bifunctional [glutamine synthetase] adenylyltransferase/[glutamine synthetase]-adenylyl-L-tyrosine phosphorylase [Arcanobacterium buesumense]|uniref:Bifunctional [glutamine synthetase] adenylyltransferase/[glutamine synthetase]-adenylyl-L-tyrosine phosphorylase n=1 Tax=Arcanobacterium buesumense TaxID=2722751 RepID=A0A6H2EJB7_9ACTO|nr:bifunctional [glutamine synthetase] adenylyltransferase/[glutamine synthetase]-adenylyl-L-tyrosine phosphorylase [Arcanobacterium buesumense]QJC21658.1 bifunctional [glutamine synthetase] adenylyltransferase/[glutamine synthetase]-adenylyl-L-tyrosine phosphorylase [Arcanobacterium buesumense]
MLNEHSDILAYAADKELARAHLARLEDALTEHTQPVWESVRQDLSQRQKLGAILGFSTALSDLLIVHPQLLTALGDQLDADHSLQIHLANDDERSHIAALRLAYYQRLITIAAHDLTHEHPHALLPKISTLISDLVDQTLQVGVNLAYRYVSDAHKIDFAVIAMGKSGARELNYISDVDVIYIAQPRDPNTPDSEVTRIGTALANWLSRAVTTPGPIPALWELDPNLRPEGKQGPLVRTLASYQAYYDRWAQPWEFQALLKARPVAGDQQTGQAFIDHVWPKVWHIANTDGFVDDVRKMRQRVEANLPRKRAERELKLAPGGLRDIEFTVQLLQLVHGRTDTTLRVAHTITAIKALSQAGYIGRQSGAKLEEHYRFLRLLEHRSQLQRLRRTHEVPPLSQLGTIATSLGYSAEELEERWHTIRREVRELHSAIFYHPLLPSLASLSPDNVVLEEHAAKERLAAIGFTDPQRALRNLHALTAGLSRTATIQRHVLPAMIGWMAQASEPDHGLNAFRDVSEQLGTTSWYMRLLRDSAVVAPRLAKLLATSRYIAAMLPTLPDAIVWLEDDAQLIPRTRDQLAHELAALLRRRKTPEQKAMAGRYLRRKEILRMAIGQTLGLVSANEVHKALSDVMDLAIEASLAAACQTTQCLARHTVIALGRLGGNEIGYVSDADVLFVYESQEGISDDVAYAEAKGVATRTLALLSAPGAEPSITADIQLRPEGKQGAVTRSIESYLAYYERWGSTWERQALLRARYCCGDKSLAQRWLAGIENFRYPHQGLAPNQVQEIQMMKIRMEKERIPRGVDPLRHVKLGRGGLADVEWTIQLLQLHFAGRYPQLRGSSTCAMITTAVSLGLMEKHEGEILIEAWSQASQIRGLNVLATGKTGSSVDIVPDDSEVLRLMAAIAHIPLQRSQDISELYARAARRARTVTNKLFYNE